LLRKAAERTVDGLWTKIYPFSPQANAQTSSPPQAMIRFEKKLL